MIPSLCSFLFFSFYHLVCFKFDLLHAWYSTLDVWKSLFEVLPQIETQKRLTLFTIPNPESLFFALFFCFLFLQLDFKKFVHKNAGFYSHTRGVFCIFVILFRLCSTRSYLLFLRILFLKPTMCSWFEKIFNHPKLN